MKSMPPCVLPLLTHNINGQPSGTTRIINALCNTAVREGLIDVTSLSIGLCNALSYCLDAIIETPNNEVAQKLTYTFEEHLQHIVTTMGQIRRNRPNVNSTSKRSS
jgi:hypothetical protein